MALNFTVGTLGLENNKIAPQLKIYPNPATNQLNFSIPALSNNLKVTICDISGRTIKTIGYKASNNGVYNQTIDISNLSRGLYLCKFNYGGKQVTRKFIKH